MAIAALANAAIGTVTGGGLPLAGQKAGQLAAGVGRRQRAARTAGAAPRRPGAQEVLIPRACQRFRRFPDHGRLR